MTIKQLKDKYVVEKGYENWYDYLDYCNSNGFDESEIGYNDLIIFCTKYHVQEALKQALESIPCLGSSSDIPTYEEVEEAIYGYSMEKAAYNFCDNVVRPKDETRSLFFAFCTGFSTHQELVKDKLFTIEDMKLFAAELIGRYKSGKIQEFEDVQDIIESYLPKTEWEVEITPEGKIVLL